MRVLAVDFGTSNTVAAFTDRPGGQVRLLSVDGWPTLPSAVWLAPQGHLVVGREAQRQARLDPSRYEPNPKSRIDDGEVLLGGSVVPVPDVIAAVLRRVADEARRQLGGDPELVVLTHPADWHQLRCATLRTAARAAGWRQVELVPEPVAAAAHFAAKDDQLRIQPGQAIAVFDMGGGTTDAAVLLRTTTGWQTLAAAGLPDLGGVDLDHALLTRVRATVQPDDPQWTELLQPATPTARRAARALADDVRAGKESLSLYPAVDIPLPEPMPDAHVTRDELEALVGQQVERAAAMLAAAITDARVPRDRLAAVYLVGGSTRMPLVAKSISRRTQLLPTAIESPETTVATGAVAAVTAPQPAAAPLTPPGTHPMPPPTPPSALPAQHSGPPPKRRSAAPWWIAAVAAVLVIGAVATVVILNRGKEQPPAQAGGGTSEQHTPSQSPPSIEKSTAEPPSIDGDSTGTAEPQLVLGPDGYGDLELYMDLTQAMSTGQLAQRSDVPAGCEAVSTVDQNGEITGTVQFNEESGYIVDITAAAPNVATPEGITVGATSDDVKSAYPNAEDVSGAHGLWLKTISDDGTAMYVFELDPDYTVIGMSLSAADESCSGV